MRCAFSYPTAWPPHQMLAWCGLERYGYAQDAQRLAYRWLYMSVLMTRVACEQIG
jgi:alpha,alpha-trehalase